MIQLFKKQFLDAINDNQESADTLMDDDSNYLEDVKTEWGIKSNPATKLIMEVLIEPAPKHDLTGSVSKANDIRTLEGNKSNPSQSRQKRPGPGRSSIITQKEKYGPKFSFIFY